ncbi:MAG TPA: hypothetical protein VGD67_25560, partial [Pseudonocardiaceae bacterium]
MQQPRHLWIRGRTRADRIRLLAGLDVPPLLAVVDGHRRLHGPYTVAGGLLHRLVPPALLATDNGGVPELVARHHVEIGCAAPDLAGLLPAGAASTPHPGRLHPPDRTLRLAHGIATLVTGLAGAQGGPVTVLLDNLQHADATDQELVSVLLRRLDPARITVVAGTRESRPPLRLAGALEVYCASLYAAAAPAPRRVPDLAAAF